MDIHFKRLLRYEYLGVLLFTIFFFLSQLSPKLREAGELNRKIRVARRAVKTLSKAEKEKQKRQLEGEFNRIQKGFNFIKKRQIINLITTTGYYDWNFTRTLARYGSRNDISKISR